MKDYKQNKVWTKTVNQPRKINICGTDSSTYAVLRASIFSSLLFLCVNCQTMPKADWEKLRFFSGKTLIVDKIKQKQDWVYFSATAEYPDRLRIDAYLGLLSIPLGTLVIDQNHAEFINLIEGKIYKTDDGSAVLEKLLKTAISPRDIIAIFSEKFPLRAPWQCVVEGAHHKCTQNDIQIDWDASNSDNKTLQIESVKAKINFSYQDKSSGKTDFKPKEPKSFEVIHL